MRVPGERPSNGHASDDFALELDALVAEELAALTPAPAEERAAVTIRRRGEPPEEGLIPEEPIERTLARLARRLRERPDRVVLLDRLRREVIGGEADPAPAKASEPRTPLPEPPPDEDRG
mgnify:CR=1 FL=1